MATAAITWALSFGILGVLFEPPWSTTAFNLASWVPVVVLLFPLVRRRCPGHWLFMAAGVVCFLAAASSATLFRHRSAEVVGSLSASDVFYVGGYACFITGVIILVGGNAKRSLREGFADLLILLVPAAVLLLEFVILPGADASDSWGLRLLAALHTLADVVLLAAALWLLAAPTTSGKWLRPMLVGLGLAVTADVLLVAELLEPTSLEESLIAATYPLTWTLLALGIAMGAAADPKPAEHTYIQWGRVALLALGVMMGPIAVALAAVGPHPLPEGGVAVAATISAALIVTRTLGLVARSERTTASLDAARIKLREAATHDPMTGLLNRSFLHDLLANPPPGGFERLVLVSLDLDGFKLVNDTLGHSAGDEVLRVVARRMADEIRPRDVVVRMGGDEFLVIAFDVGEAELTPLLRRLLDRIAEPVDMAGVVPGAAPAHVSASAGISVVAAGATAEAIDAALNRSDQAMYAAKRSGPGQLLVG